MKKLNLLKGKAGTTLVEVVAGLAILSLLFLFIAMVFPTAISIVGRQAQLKHSGKNAADGLENRLAGQLPESGSALNETPGQLEIDFPAGSLRPDGVFVRSRGADGNAVYYYFEAD